jgi:hypothetical protein
MMSFVCPYVPRMIFLCSIKLSMCNMYARLSARLNDCIWGIKKNVRPLARLRLSQEGEKWYYTENECEAGL